MNIEPIPYFYEAIDRNAIIVKPKKPFFDWLNKTFNDKKPITDSREKSIYLVREMESIENVMRWIKSNFDMIFCNELNGWCLDEQTWPKKRTFAMFSTWFNIEIASMILDLEDYAVNKD